jgi:hypothetical protein
MITFSIEQEFIGTLPDGIVKENSWDINQNGVKDQFEDTNQDGLFTDYDFWTRGAGMRHFVNVLLYIILIVVLYFVFSNYIFPQLKDMVFIACLLFAVHPLHTEVVANIKSRDEILSFLFIALTLLYVFLFSSSGSKKHLFYSGLFMFLALLSKEYAVFLFLLIPVIFYAIKSSLLDFKDRNFWFIVILVFISSVLMIYFFNSGTLIAVPILFAYLGYSFVKKSAMPIISIMYALGVSLILYLALRFSATSHDVYNSDSFQNDVLGNPYLFATLNQVWASKIAIWLKYLTLFFIPYPLVVDYSYNSIPYSDFTNVKVWLSLLIYCSLILLALYSFLKKKKWTIGIVWFLLFFIPVSNVLFDIGATMGERLIFHSSFGLCIVLAYIVHYFLKYFHSKHTKIVLVILFVLGAQAITYAFLTINRNKEYIFK